MYVLHGDDSYLQAERRSRLVDCLIGDSDPQMALRTFEGDAELVDVLDELRTLPFLAPRRVVIVSNADDFVQKHRESIEKYFDNPADGGTLILILRSWKTNTRLHKKISGGIGEVISCSSPMGQELHSWVANQTKQYGKKINSDAIISLIATVGNNLSTLKEELEKLCAYTGDINTITSADIGEVVAGSTPPEAFALTEALTTGNTSEALNLLHGAMMVPGAEFMILGQIAWHVRRCLAGRQQLDATGSMSVALKAASAWKNKDDMARLLRERPLRLMQADMRSVLKADLGMKSGLEPVDVLQCLVATLCQKS